VLNPPPSDKSNLPKPQPLPAPANPRPDPQPIPIVTADHVITDEKEPADIEKDECSEETEGNQGGLSADSRGGGGGCLGGGGSGSAAVRIGLREDGRVVGRRCKDGQRLVAGKGLMQEVGRLLSDLCLYWGT